jgi:hypothetical protein
MQWSEMVRETMRLQWVKVMGRDRTASPSGYEAIQVEHNEGQGKWGVTKGKKEGGTTQNGTEKARDSEKERRRQPERVTFTLIKKKRALQKQISNICGTCTIHTISHVGS